MDGKETTYTYVTNIGPHAVIKRHRPGGTPPKPYDPSDDNPFGQLRDMPWSEMAQVLASLGHSSPAPQPHIQRQRASRRRP